MISSSIITAICFMVVFYEVMSAFLVLRTCKRIRCTVVSSKKISRREDECIVDEFYLTEVDFVSEDQHRTASLHTNMICQKGQILSCYYYPRKNIVFRKRDLRSVLHAHSIHAFTVGLVFMLLNLLFQMTSLGTIIASHAIEAFTILLTLAFFVFGIWFIIYGINAQDQTRKSKITTIQAEVSDVIRKSRRHRENVHFMYYPIYNYSLNGTRHVVQSKVAREKKPNIGSKEEILVDLQKGSVVEYKDIESSFWLGTIFLILAILMMISVIFT